jgi:hypothetical protein
MPILQVLQGADYEFSPCHAYNQLSLFD